MPTDNGDDTISPSLLYLQPSAQHYGDPSQTFTSGQSKFVTDTALLTIYKIDQSTASYLPPSPPETQATGVSQDNFDWDDFVDFDPEPRAFEGSGGM
jgi:hypothetical protein